MESNYGLGKYQKHILSVDYVNNDDKYCLVCGSIKITFPHECILQLIYEKGYEEYRAFNIPIDTIKQINILSINDFEIKQKDKLQQSIYINNSELKIACVVYDEDKECQPN